MIDLISSTPKGPVVPFEKDPNPGIEFCIDDDNINVDGPISSSAPGSNSMSSSSTRAAKASEFAILCHPFHNGAITGVDVCQRKPIVVTCGVDKVGFPK